MSNKPVKILENTNVGVSAFYTFITMLDQKWDGSPATLSDYIFTISVINSDEEKSQLRIPSLHTPPFTP